MKNIRFLVLFLVKSFQRYRKAVFFVIIGIFILILFGMKVSGHFIKTTITEGVIGTYTKDTLPDSVTELLSQGLVRLDSSGQPRPNLVTGWEVNKDVNEYTFKLKPNLKWSDGSSIKAPDIALSLPDAQESAPDDHTIVFKLKDSFSPFPTLLTKPIFKKGTDIGIGPYQLSSLKTPKVFVEEASLNSADPSLPDVVIRFYPSEKTADTALRIGEVESILEVTDPGPFQSDGPFELIQKQNHSRLVTIFYNTEDATLSDKNMRLALSYAAPSIKGEEEAVTSLPKSSWAFNPNVRDYLDNPVEAKIYLSKVDDLQSKPVVLTSTTSLQLVGEQIVKAWNSQGIKATLRVESGIPQNFQALLIAQDIPLDPDQYSLWHSTQTETNISHYASKRVDKDLEDGRKIFDQKTRIDRYQDFQKVLLDDSPATFLYFPKYTVVSVKKIDSPLNKVLKLQLSDLTS